MNIQQTIRATAMGLGVLIGCSLPAYAMTPLQITSNTSVDSNPQIHGNHVVWQGKVNNNWEIFHYDISTGITTQVTNNTTDDYSPATDGEYIVWLTKDGWLVKWYDIDTGTTRTIPDDGTACITSAPEIENGYITYTQTAISEFGSTLSGTYVFVVKLNEYGVIDFTWRLDRLADNYCLLTESDSKIYDGKVGWTVFDNQGTEEPDDDLDTFYIFDVNGTGVTAQPWNYSWPHTPQRDGDLVVVSQRVGTDKEIILRKGVEKIQLTDNTVDDSSPCISGTTVAWVSGTDEAAEIFIATETETDGDGVNDSFDNCVNAANSDQADSDNDGVGDACDNCVAVANSDQLDTNGDGLGDACTVVPCVGDECIVSIDFRNDLNSYSGAEDSWVSSGSIDSNYGNDTEVQADGYDTNTNGELLSLLKWDISSIPQGATVTSASITFKANGSSAGTYGFYAMGGSWSEDTVTWSNANIDANQGLPVGYVQPYTTGYYTVPLNSDGIALLQSWVNGTDNNGLMIRSTGTEDGLVFFSSEYEDVIGRRPTLSVTYEKAPGTVDLRDGTDGYSGTMDSYVASDYIDDNFGSNTSVSADGDGWRGELVSLLKWDVSSVPQAATVTSAVITVYITNDTWEAYYFYGMNGAWSEDTVTWSNAGIDANQGLEVLSFTPDDVGRYTLTLNSDGVALVQSWVDGTTANNGLMIRSDSSNGIDFRSSEYGTVTQRPTLSITYE